MDDKSYTKPTGMVKGTVKAANATCAPALIGQNQKAPTVATEDKITSQSVAITKKN